MGRKDGSRVARMPSSQNRDMGHRFWGEVYAWATRPVGLHEWGTLHPRYGVDFMYGRPADESLWRTRRTWCIKTLVRDGQKVGFGNLRNGNPGLLEILRLGDFREILISKSPAHKIAKREQ